MKMNLPNAQWTDWEEFSLPGGNSVLRIFGAAGSQPPSPFGGTQFWFPRLWAIDNKNDLWSCESTTFPNRETSEWTPWVAPYPNN